ncbi:MAG: hypothetical protein JOZ24_00375 [Candidatus Eremiobacteraeota bacterium]|nr:hypothetical protein [Candidatus Eremiobacteraeota bacterium]
MPLGEYASREALRQAADWLTMHDPPGAAEAREGIANLIGIAMMGALTADDLDDLASQVEENAPTPPAADVPPEAARAQVNDAIRRAFDHVRSSAGTA